MHCWGVSLETSVVALLAEGVDRNRKKFGFDKEWTKSPSSQRAWIEIQLPQGKVSMRRSPSSRRAWIEILWLFRFCC